MSSFYDFLNSIISLLQKQANDAAVSDGVSLSTAVATAQCTASASVITLAASTVTSIITEPVTVFVTVSPTTSGSLAAASSTSTNSDSSTHTTSLFSQISSTISSSSYSSTAISSVSSSSDTSSSVSSSGTTSSSAASSTSSAAASSSTQSTSSSAAASSSTASVSSSASSASSSITSSVTSSTATQTSSTSTSASASASATATGILGIKQTILCIVPSASDAFNCYSGLEGYGIPWEVLVVPSTGATLPTLNSSGYGNYGGIVTMAELSYNYGGTIGWGSALTDAQWQALYDYQTNFGVRMARLDVYPTSDFGVTVKAPTGGCCDSDTDIQQWSFTNITGFETSGIKVGGTIPMVGLWHYSATITGSNTWEVAKLAAGGSVTADGTTAVINRIANGSGNREQMVFFTSFATAWSQASNFIQHSWIHWMTRGLYVGHRRLYLGTQIDDVLLGTTLYSSTTSFRLRTADLANHVSWMTSINSRMPSGSKYFIELGYNGNGNIENATLSTGGGICNPDSNVVTAYKIPLVDQEFKKPIGSGEDAWPTTPTEFTWSTECQNLDPLLVWVKANLDSFAHVSHTFTHLALSNATYSDTVKEITFNQAFFSKTGISSHTRFSVNGLIPPQITGLHNGDAIRAFMENGIKYVVGDNTRSALLNTAEPFWTLTTTEASDGYAGLEIVPRYATNVFYDCDVPDRNTLEWVNTLGGTNSFSDLMQQERVSHTRSLLGLHHDPYMFHQANLRQADQSSITLTNGKTYAQHSLLMIWVEEIVDEMTRLVDWPFVTLKHDDIAAAFLARRTRDTCKPALQWNYSADGKSIIGATVSATDSNCQTPIPVTFPGPVTSDNGQTKEQLGNDPLTIWTQLSGSPVTFNLATPVKLS